MKKESDKPLFWKVLVIVQILLIVNVGMVLKDYGRNFTGYSISSISGGFAKTYGVISPVSKMILLLQWLFILVVLFSVFIRDRHINIKEKDVEDIRTQSESKATTDLDTLYGLLKEKKVLRLSVIASAFKVSKEVALSWCKILEAGNLAVIDYPGIGEPEIKIKEENNEKKQA